MAGERGEGMVSERFSGEPGGMLAGFAEGSQIAGYRLEVRIGAGGMAVVFRAHDVRLERRVALKILAPAVAADEAFRQRFIRESRAAAAVDDPFIIPVFEAGEADGVLFIAMRYVPGGDVHSLVRRVGPLSPGRAAAIVSSVASALDAAHAAGLVHRDVKPANMLVDVQPGRPDHVYLSDFGLSKGALSSHGLTASGQFLGTPGYSAPEQMQGKPADGRADQYSLACAAFDLLSGAPPFPRDQVTAVIWAHMSEPPPPLTSRRPGLPAAVDGVVARALAKAPADRYASCREFADALRAALGLESYNSGSGTAPDEEMIDRPAPHEARHARSSLLAQPGASTYATATAPGPPPAVEPVPGPRLHHVAGEAQPATRHPEGSDHPGSGLTRRKLLLSGAACSAAAGLGGLAWDLRTQHGAARGTGRQRSRRNPTEPGPGTTIWQADVPFRPLAHWVNLILGGGVLCVQGATEMFALRASDGTQLWKFKVPGNGDIAGLQVPGSGGINGVAATQNAVYLSPAETVSKLYALRSGDGKTLWTVPVPGSVTVVAAGAAYVVGDQNPFSLYALSASDGAKIWEFPAETLAAPVVNASIVYFLSGGLNPPYLLRALQASNGKQIWSSPAPGFQGPLAIGGNTICSLHGDGATLPSSLWAWRASDGKELWKSDANGGFVSVAISGNVVYAVSGSSELIALDASDGTKIWGYPASVNTVPAISKGLVYVGSAGGGLVALRASNGKPVWQSSTYFTTGPVVEAEAVYVADVAKVYALRTLPNILAS
jgi:serine/threonine protein kinase/outer membrane protein assembly factor BamB